MKPGDGFINIFDENDRVTIKDLVYDKSLDEYIVEFYSLHLIGVSRLPRTLFENRYDKITGAE